MRIGQQQRDARRFGLQTRVEPGLADKHRVAAQLAGGLEKPAGASASDGHGPDRLADITDHRKPFDGKELLDLLDQTADGHRAAEPSPASGAEPLIVGNQRPDVLEPQPFGQPLVDPLGRRIERGVRAVDGDPGSDQIQEESAAGRFRGQTPQWLKRQGVVRNHQLGSLLDRLGGACRGGGQAGHRPGNVPAPITRQEPDVVPILCQAGRGKLIQEVGNLGNRWHGQFPEAAEGTPPYTEIRGVSRPPRRRFPPIMESGVGVNPFSCGTRISIDLQRVFVLLPWWGYRIGDRGTGNAVGASL